jgi:hypothetical protein
MTTRERLIAEAEALCEGATPGPWEYVALNDKSWLNYIMGDDGLVTVAALSDCEQNDADAAFIARARTLVPELVALLKEPEQVPMREPSDSRRQSASVDARGQTSAASGGAPGNRNPESTAFDSAARERAVRAVFGLRAYRRINYENDFNKDDIRAEVDAVCAALLDSAALEREKP